MIVAVLDACVLVPSVVADTLLRCAEQGLYRPLWSAEILDEVRRHLPDSVNDGHPDDFLCDLLDTSPDRIVGIIREQADATGRLGHPKLTVDDIVLGLIGCNVTRFAHRLSTAIRRGEEFWHPDSP